MIGEINSHVPSGPLEQKWSKHKFDSKLINPANRRKYEIIVVGSGWPAPAPQRRLGNLATR
jgi:succinate dehydrogenase / fumarate reductase flavoprotein subunit